VQVTGAVDGTHAAYANDLLDEVAIQKNVAGLKLLRWGTLPLVQVLGDVVSVQMILQAEASHLPPPARKKIIAKNDA